MGFKPQTSGIFSAGNGPCMRSPLIGVWDRRDEMVGELVRASTRITHTDPQAEEGAIVVARAARLAVSGQSITPTEFIDAAAEQARGEKLRDLLKAASHGLATGKSCLEFAESQGWTRGVSGYVNHTVPAVLYCWANSPRDFRQCVESAVALGGDTDTVAAIAGAIAGANLGSEAIPEQWFKTLFLWPRSLDWLRELARHLADVEHSVVSPPPMYWLATTARNLAFAAIVLSLGFRRLLPPY